MYVNFVCLILKTKQIRKCMQCIIDLIRFNIQSEIYFDFLKFSSIFLDNLCHLQSTSVYNQIDFCTRRKKESIDWQHIYAQMFTMCPLSIRLSCLALSTTTDENTCGFFDTHINIELITQFRCVKYDCIYDRAMRLFCFCFRFCLFTNKSIN